MVAALRRLKIVYLLMFIFQDTEITNHRAENHTKLLLLKLFATAFGYWNKKLVGNGTAMQVEKVSFYSRNKMLYNELTCLVM